jgi:hypothetical protein
MHKAVLPSNYTISLLHQQFICIHLPATHLPRNRGFSLTVHHRFLTKAAAQSGLTTPPAQRCQSARKFSLPSLSLKELAWHKHWRQVNFSHTSLKYSYYMLNPPEADSLSQSRTCGAAFASLKKCPPGRMPLLLQAPSRRGGEL